MSNIRTEKARRNKLVPASRCTISNIQATSAAAAPGLTDIRRHRASQQTNRRAMNRPSARSHVTSIAGRLRALTAALVDRHVRHNMNDDRDECNRGERQSSITFRSFSKPRTGGGFRPGSALLATTVSDAEAQTAGMER